MKEGEADCDTMRVFTYIHPGAKIHTVTWVVSEQMAVSRRD